MIFKGGTNIRWPAHEMRMRQGDCIGCSSCESISVPPFRWQAPIISDARAFPGLEKCFGWGVTDTEVEGRADCLRLPVRLSTNLNLPPTASNLHAPASGKRGPGNKTQLFSGTQRDREKDLQFGKISSCTYGPQPRHIMQPSKHAWTMFSEHPNVIFAPNNNLQWGRKWWGCRAAVAWWPWQVHTTTRWIFIILFPFYFIARWLCLERMSFVEQMVGPHWGVHNSSCLQIENKFLITFFFWNTFYHIWSLSAIFLCLMLWKRKRIVEQVVNFPHCTFHLCPFAFSQMRIYNEQGWIGW